MHNLVLSVNAGSSSLKISLYTAQHDDNDEPVNLLLTSSISNISAPPAKFSFKSVNATKDAEPTKDAPVDSIHDHASAFEHFLDHLKREANIDREQITRICHRVVHGGDYHDPVIISDESYHHIEKLSDLAPLHNGAALSVIKACIANLPSSTSIAFFDTAFHRPMPPYIANYAINQTIARKRGLKKYGFHGLSYAFILRSVARFLNKPPDALNLIVLHLGSGASACAIRQGLSLDTSMGLTPLNGLPGATRAGAIDPSLIFHYTNKAGRITHDRKAAIQLHVTEAEDILNTKSGWKALTGTTDFGVITEKADLSNPNPDYDENPHRLAFDILVDRIMDYVGGYFLKLGGRVDALVFAGGIGERSEPLRARIGEQVKCLGFAGLDGSKNEAVDTVDGSVVDIGQGGSQERKILVCRTDEQLEMARECVLKKEFWDEPTP
ncbi:hypothetical protein HGRIS_003530 [Hohenbuehelia grisea]|uniref:Probable acetate kinase n=1 Tax=Hohenbuehelia grisea TaxID=104357 RepID=A0ABR3JGJ1_9AGAR